MLKFILIFTSVYTLFLTTHYFLFKKLKSPQSQLPSKQEIRNDIFWSIVHVGSHLVLRIGVIFIYFSPYNFFKIYTNHENYSISYSILSGIFLFLVIDFFGYWTHRLLHVNDKTYYILNGPHHFTRNVNPLTSFSSTPIFLFLYYLPALVLICFMPVHIGAIIIGGLFKFYQQIWAHFGTNSNLQNNKYFFWLPKYIYLYEDHSLHHFEFKTNYGMCLKIWDQLFGTYSKNSSDFQKIAN